VFTLHNTEITFGLENYTNGEQKSKDDMLKAESTFGLENYADGEHEQRRHAKKILFPLDLPHMGAQVDQ
jgi:hypothetical protein